MLLPAGILTDANIVSNVIFALICVFIMVKRNMRGEILKLTGRLL